MLPFLIYPALDLVHKKSSCISLRELPLRLLELDWQKMNEQKDIMEHQPLLQLVLLGWEVYLMLCPELLFLQVLLLDL